MRKEIIGNCELYLGDSRDMLPEISADAIVTDPPYLFDTAREQESSAASGPAWTKSSDKLDEGFDHGIRLGFKSCAVFCHNDQLVELLPYLASEYDRYALCAWHKTNPMPVANRHYQPDTELYIHAWQKGAHPDGEL